MNKSCADRPEYSANQAFNRVEDAAVMRDPVKHRQNIMGIVAPRRTQVVMPLFVCRLGLGQFGNDLGGKDIGGDKFCRHNAVFHLKAS